MTKEKTEVSITSTASIRKFIRSRPSLAELQQLQATCHTLGLRKQYSLLQEAICDCRNSYAGAGNYEVYVVKDNKGNFLYIGSGEHGRHKHCTSGTSHCYELNRMHHTEQDYTVAVIKHEMTKTASLSLEKQLIMEHKPLFNKTHNKKNKPKNGNRTEDIDFNSYSKVYDYISDDPNEDTLKAILDYTQEDSIRMLVAKELYDR